MLLCEYEIITILIGFLNIFETNPEFLSKVIKIFRCLSTEPTVINSLENVGIIPIVVHLI